MLDDFTLLWGLKKNGRQTKDQLLGALGWTELHFVGIKDGLVRQDLVASVAEAGTTYYNLTHKGQEALAGLSGG